MATINDRRMPLWAPACNVDERPGDVEETSPIPALPWLHLLASIPIAIACGFR